MLPETSWYSDKPTTRQALAGYHRADYVNRMECAIYGPIRFGVMFESEHQVGKARTE